MDFEDKTLTCADCGVDFVFTAGEQQFFQSKGYTNEPKRCPSCRQIRRAQRGGQGNGNNQTRQMFKTVCAACGKEAEVPFEPREGRPVYCRDCYSNTRLTANQQA